MDVNGVIHEFVIDEERSEIYIVVNEDASNPETLVEKTYAIAPTCTYKHISKPDIREIHGRRF